MNDDNINDDQTWTMVINDGYVKQQKESDAKIELKNVGAKKMWYNVI